MAIFSRNKEAEARLVAQTAAAFDELGRLALDGVIPIGQVEWRAQVKVAGRVKALRVQPWSEKIQSLELTLVDGTGGITVVFLGRRKIAGLHPGTVMRVRGVAGAHHGRLALMNPEYELLETPHIEAPHH